jgi:hypothetical protein
MPERSALLCLALFIGFAVVAVGLYERALAAPFVSDDYGYIVSHPHTETLDRESLREIFDPWGPAKLYTANYAPVHLLLTAVERELFGEYTLGYHIVNVALHALVAVLLVTWLWQLGVGRNLAVVAGLVFLVHPANVEAVAWSSQLKTLAAMAFSLAALLALRKLPAIATLLFLLALLTKSAALFVLPTAAAVAWTLGGADGRRIFAWLTGWVAIAGLWAVPHLASFEHMTAVDIEAFDDPLVHLYTVASVGMRYVAMAATSYGVSAWQEPPPALVPMDPWVIGAVIVAIAILVRVAITLRTRSSELVFWVAAGAAFLPVSQIQPFAAPMADRYLYFMLPGLMGGCLLAARALALRMQIDVPRLAPILGALALIAVFGFGWRVSERVPLWQSESHLLLDAAIHYPEGSTAAFMRARRAAQDGEVEVAVAQLRLAAERGVDAFMALPQDPGLASLREEPAFDELLRELAGQWIARARARGYSTQPELRVLGIAHLQREEYHEAVEAFEAALDVGGPLDDYLQIDLEDARLRLESVQAMVRWP